MFVVIFKVTMDLYLINGQDGISLPEMIDWDIKLCDSEINEEVGVNSVMGLSYDLPSLDIEDEPNPLWTQSYSTNSNSSFELDFLGEGGSALMVNPSSVMPFVSSQRGLINIIKADDSEEESSHFQNHKNDEKTLISVKTESLWTSSKTSKMETVDGEREDINRKEKIKQEELCEQNESLTQVDDIMSIPIEFVSVTSQDSYIEVTPTKNIPSQKRQVISCGSDETIKSYPKPAYSYSCLIAMALKNSQTGSLPVSEIYSFMCHHFPYFKTAPSGWKNSVRHNLSLNKCFEKIEKPPSTGSSGSQRKGCLWAMNPAKITKMDEEVAKWSRKDPLAIKKAMVCPDNLELLERGELKDFFDEEEIEEDCEDIKEEEVEDFIDDADDERISSIDDDSEDEISKVPPSLQPFEPKFAHLSRHKSMENNGFSESSMYFKNKVNFEVGDGIYDELEVSDTRTLLGLDDSVPLYAVDPGDDNMLIELPLVKKPRVQNNYIYEPMLNIKRHNTNSFRSIKIQSP